MDRPLGSAWLLTWESIGKQKPPPPGGNAVIAVLNYRWSADKVRDFVEQIYIALTAHPSDKIAIARDRKANPYPTMFGNVGGVPIADQMHCGHNPWIAARRVRNVRLDKVDGEDRVAWDEVPLPKVPDFLMRPAKDV